MIDLLELNKAITKALELLVHANIVRLDAETRQNAINVARARVEALAEALKAPPIEFLTEPLDLPEKAQRQTYIAFRDEIKFRLGVVLSQWQNDENFTFTQEHAALFITTFRGLHGLGAKLVKFDTEAFRAGESETGPVPDVVVFPSRPLAQQVSSVLITTCFQVGMDLKTRALVNNTSDDSDVSRLTDRFRCRLLLQAYELFLQRSAWDVSFTQTEAI